MTPGHAVALVCLSASIAGSVAAGASVKEQVTPLQKLLQMLDGLSVKGKQEKHQEEVEFAKFHEWCDDVQATRTKSIKEAEAQIEQLNADIMKATSDAEVLGGEVADLEKSIGEQEDEAKSATDQRNKEHANYATEHKDLSESIDATQRAVQALAARSADVAQSLAQVGSLKRIPAHSAALIQAFLSGSSNEANVDQASPEANAYEFQSGGIVAVLEKLNGKFKDQLLVLEKEEMNSKANYEVLLQQLEDNIKQEKASVAAKTAAKAKRLEDAATGKGDLAATETGKSEDEKTLIDTIGECKARSQEFEKNQVTRAEEVRAISKAMEILSSDDVTGNAEKHLPAAALLQQGHSFAQLQVQDLLPATRQKALEMLQARAKQLGSRYLAFAASRVAADPFAKVKKIIQDLVTKLTEEANAEADQHAYCTSELAMNKQTRQDKTAEVDALTADIEELTAKSTRLATEIQELTDAIAEIRGQQEEASNLRAAESKENAQAVADAKEAQVAVEKATQVLRAYYAKAADAAFVQGTQASSLSQEMAVAARAPYKGMQSASTGIFGMLEVVMSDFARLESETAANEESAASAHNKFVDETNESVAVKETEVEHKENKRRLTDERARSSKKELEFTQEELDKAMNYHDKLKGECVDSGLSYEERVHAREQEIQSLKEALEVLGQSQVD